MKQAKLKLLAKAVKVSTRAPRLASVDLSPELDKKEYKERKKELEKRLLALQLELRNRRIPVVIVVEGWDAAGKGGAIHRLVNKFDPRSYFVHPISAPSQEEKDHHYLWRFWRALPARGRIAVFDRSWYGRVLVERIEGYADEREWRRAFDEINEFERQLAVDGHLLVKVFLHISKQEQRQRFEARAANPLKAWKMTDEDYRNRRKWDRYQDAIDEMFARTHSKWAPWHAIAANDKRWARIAVQEACVAHFARALMNGDKKAPKLLAKKIGKKAANEVVETAVKAVKASAAGG
jgi:polyphosphate kinase 2 (PPK2 family)